VSRLPFVFPFGAVRLVISLRPGIAVPLSNATVVGIGERSLVLGARAALLRERGPRRDAPNELCITRDHFYHLGRERHVGPRGALDSSLTRFANGHGDLVRRAPRIGGSPQDVARHLEEERVIVHRFGGSAPNGGRSFSKGRVRLRAHVEAKDVPARLGARAIGGPSSGRLSGDELLDLADGLSSRGFEPFALRVGRRHPRELAHGRPGKRAAREGRVKLGKALEGGRRPELVVGGSSAVAEQPLDVLLERCIPEMAVHADALGAEQHQALAAVQLRAFLREPLELLVYQDPVHVPIDPNTRCHEWSIHPCFTSSLVTRRRAFVARLASQTVFAPKPRERPVQRTPKAICKAHLRWRSTNAQENRQEESARPH